ncbi:uncharacterized protein LOC106089706 [Stomoxys calcitrans]|uniref:Male-enhanced antigen 1 n=1 Tax=Stomoxys calcitrans TaxID=35570 RepID=A0A1I8PTL8_STOCA|nr:uncharacterized protein LOC106089706 [Stomoxys calcitrans]
MGAPELPNDPGEEDLRTVHMAQNPPIVASDESDNESLDDYDGYQPLAMDDNQMEYTSIALQEDDDDDGTAEQESFNRTRPPVNTIEENVEPQQSAEDVEVTHGDPNLPPIESIDAEIEREVWSQPRPEELQIELDSSKTQQILSAMANFTLPNIGVPSWAEGVPEERWKEELLQRIRQRKPATNDATMDVDKETK